MRLVFDSPYESYAYAYPHKTAYRPFDPPVALRNLWQPEQNDALFLYVHIPFCEMRCGFCNLFTTVNPADDYPHHYLETLQQQIIRTRAALGEDATFARLAIGGGTPTFLEADELRRLFGMLDGGFDLEFATIPSSVETSPKTATADRLHVLREFNVDRISIGVQSFHEDEARAAGRPQATCDVLAALDCIRSFDFPTLNIDLIYGLPGQTVSSWLCSLQTALSFEPEELYLYPLYVRPLTGLDKLQRQWDDDRMACYRAGRDYLLAQGYEQKSMRMFRKPNTNAAVAPVYTCQEDGMVGLGCGARSYTRNVHYSSEYAVTQQNVKAILHDYVQRDVCTFDYAYHGFELSPDEQHRRYVLKSLLQVEGLALDQYCDYFGTETMHDLPQLSHLIESELATVDNGQLKLTDRGLALSDAIAPWLYSTPVKKLMQEYDLR